MWQNLFMSFNKDFIKIDHSRCLRTYNEHSQCTKCEDICPQPALKIKDRSPEFDEGTCSNCRLCVHICPTEALQNEKETLQAYEKKIQMYENIYFACKEFGSKESDLILPCILSLTPEVLMIASLYHKKVFILWDEKSCLSCPSNWTHKRCLEWVNMWNQNMMSKEKVEIIKNKRAIKSQLPKTEKMTLGKKDFKNLPSKIEADVLDRNSDSHNNNKLPLTIRRKYLIAYIKEKKMLGSIPNLIQEKIGLTNLSVTNNCQLCSKCSQVCPTGALERREAGKEKSLVFKPSYCINCDICEHSCLEITKIPIRFEEIDCEFILKRGV